MVRILFLVKYKKLQGGNKMPRRGENISKERMDGGKQDISAATKTEKQNTNIFTVKHIPKLRASAILS